MKKTIKKIKTLLENHPKIMVLMLVIILLLVVFLTFRIADKYMNLSKTENMKIYTYIDTKKFETNAKVNLNKRREINSIEPEQNIIWTSAPIYSKDKIILSKDMIITFPLDNYNQKRLKPYTYIEKEYLITNNYKEKLKDYFIYDGNNFYLLGNESSLILDGKEIKLSKYSYVICDNNYVVYYDYKLNKIESVENINEAVISNQYYKINLKDDTVGNEDILLPNGVEYLDLINKKVNK